jgi:nucleoside-diphosphate-sugar epimerase
MKIAVTGANGHVGANLCRTLIAEGHQVKALVHHQKNAISSLPLEIVHGNLNDKESLRKLLKGCEVVFHLAALISIAGKRDKLIETNVKGTQNLLEVISENGVRRLVHFSSVHALSHRPFDKPMDENRPLVEESPMWYEITKSRGEKMVREAVSKGLDAVIINPCAIVGPHDYKPSLVGTVLMQMYSGSLPALVPGGYNWVDVRDIVQGAVSAMDNGRKGESYILSGHYVSVKELARTVEKVTGKKVTRFMIPTAVAKIGVPFVKAYAGITKTEPLYTFDSLRTLLEVNQHISSAKASKDLGYKPRSLDMTIRDTIDWFSSQGLIK